MSGDPRLVETARLATVGQLAAGAAHEINNPLFAIMGLVELLLIDVEPGTKTHDRLELVQETALEIKAIVRAMLDLARPADDERRRLRLDDVARASAALFRRLDADKTMEIVERYEPGDTMVEASPARLTQLFVHLLRAARGSAKVTLGVEPADDGVVAEVRHGQGLPEDDLGLAAARLIAELHGGTLTTDETGFRVWLPRADRSGDEQTTLPGRR